MGAMADWLHEAAQRRQRRGVVRHTALRTEPRNGPRPLDLASNDYLGLSRDPRLIRAATRATAEYGTGSRASRVVTGTHPIHVELEQELAGLTGQPSCLVFSSGYTANVGVLVALGSPRTLLALDSHAHASLIDGARLSRSVVETWQHGDLAELERLLAGRTQPRAVVVVESVYSVQGDTADLSSLAQLCARYDAVLLVDEAHGIGVLGAGRGAVHAAGLAGAEHVVMTATLSKALGAQGGAVLGPELLREHLVNTARTFLFDTALAPAPAGAAAEACRIVRAEPERVGALHRNAAEIAARCAVPRAAGAVQSIPVGTADGAAGITAQLEDSGVLVGCFRPPSVPDGVSRIRVTARADLDSERLRTAADLIAATVAMHPEGRCLITS
jgi:8-amino-7-oxononanoate synthase